jgi:hypothetical protein
MGVKLIITENQLKKIMEVNHHETLVQKIVDELNMNYEPIKSFERNNGEYKESPMVRIKVDGDEIAVKDLFKYLKNKWKIGDEFIKQVIRDWFTGKIKDGNNLSKNVAINEMTLIKLGYKLINHRYIQLNDNTYYSIWEFKNNSKRLFEIKNKFTLLESIDYPEFYIKSNKFILIENDYSISSYDLKHGENIYSKTNNNDVLMIVSTVLNSIKNDLQECLTFKHFKNIDIEPIDTFVLDFIAYLSKDDYINGVENNKRARLYDKYIRELATVTKVIKDGNGFQYVLTDLKL